MSRDSKSNDDQKKQQQKTRLQAELGHRYSALTPARRKPKPGAGSLTEDLAAAEPEVEPEAEQDQEQEVAAEGQELAAEAAPKSLFELPRKEPSRPSLLGGGVEVAPTAPAGSGTPQPPANAPAPFGKPPPRRG